MPFHDLEYQDNDDFVDALYRRTEELYGVDDLMPDEEGLVEAVVLPLRGVIIYPQMVSPLFISREKIRKIIEDAQEQNQTLTGVFSQSGSKWR